MATEKVRVTRHTCDDCGKQEYSDHEPAHGITINWAEIDGTGGNGGTIWACSEACAVAAFDNRFALLKR